MITTLPEIPKNINYWSKLPEGAIPHKRLYKLTENFSFEDKKALLIMVDKIYDNPKKYFPQENKDLHKNKKFGKIENIVLEILQSWSENDKDKLNLFLFHTLFDTLSALDILKIKALFKKTFRVDEKNKKHTQDIMWDKNYVSLALEKASEIKKKQNEIGLNIRVFILNRTLRLTPKDLDEIQLEEYKKFVDELDSTKN